MQKAYHDTQHEKATYITPPPSAYYHKVYLDPTLNRSWYKTQSMQPKMPLLFILAGFSTSTSSICYLQTFEILNPINPTHEPSSASPNKSGLKPACNEILAIPSLIRLWLAVKEVKKVTRVREPYYLLYAHNIVWYISCSS